MLGLSLPSAVLRFLTRLCTRGGSYEYKVCPFHNATQRELAESWNSFYGILGYGSVGCAPVDMCVRHVGLSVVRCVQDLGRVDCRGGRLLRNAVHRRHILFARPATKHQGTWHAKDPCWM